MHIGMYVRNQAIHDNMSTIDKQALFLLYDAPDNAAQVQVVVKDETIWMTQKAMASLFDVDKSSISRHLKNIFESGELTPEATVAKIATVVNRGIRGAVTEDVDFYNLDMIISVGYRVNSARATRFRQWATKILNEYNRTQPINSDFDKEIKRMIEQNSDSNTSK